MSKSSKSRNNRGEIFKVVNDKGKVLGEFNTRQEANDFVSDYYPHNAWYQPELKDVVVEAYAPNSPAALFNDQLSRQSKMPTASDLQISYKVPHYSPDKVNDTVSDVERERYLHNLEKSGFDFDYANKVLKADRHAQQYNPVNFLYGTGINVLDPSQWVGATSDLITDKTDTNGNRIGFWTSLGQGNSGFVTDKFMKEHPILGPITNMVGGSATIGLGNAAYKLTKPLVVKRINTLLENPLFSNKNLIPIDYNALKYNNQIVNKPGSKYKINNQLPITSPETQLYKSNFLFNKKLNKEKVIDDIISGRATTKFSDQQWDDFFNFAINAKDPMLAYKLRDSHFAVKSGYSPQIWYHGAPYSGHAVFDSSVFNSTNGGASAAGKIKGSFLTDDLSTANSYSIGMGSDNLPFYMQRVVEKHGRFPGKKYMDKAAPLHPSDNGALNLKQMHTYTEPIVQLFNKTPRNSLQGGVYPFYVKPGKTLTVDFKGNYWNESPVDFPTKYRLVEKWYEYDPDYGLVDKVKNGIETEDLTALTNKVKELNLPYQRRRAFDQKGNEIIESYVPMDRDMPKSSYTNQAIYQQHGPTYSVYVEPVYYPKTTNGAVQYGASEGYNSIKINNVIDPARSWDNPHPITDFIPLQSNQMKLAVPITYDNEGKIIPLSKRDNFTNPDIRYKKGGKLNEKD